MSARARTHTQHHSPAHTPRRDHPSIDTRVFFGGLSIDAIDDRYMPAKYKEFIPFVKPCPLSPEEEAARKKAGGKAGGKAKKGKN